MAVLQPWQHGAAAMPAWPGPVRMSSASLTPWPARCA